MNMKTSETRKKRGIQERHSNRKLMARNYQSRSKTQAEKQPREPGAWITINQRILIQPETQTLGGRPSTMTGTTGILLC